MNILILGSDGYLGFATYNYLKEKGHTVFGIDNFSKRLRELECGVKPLFDRPKFADFDGDVQRGDIRDIIHSVKPEVIIHYAEQPSAPYSMRGVGEAIDTQTNNVIGTLNLLWAIREVCPKAHLIKIGTMGEYGTPNIDIEEGWLDVVHNGRKDRVIYPKRASSWYHLSKVHDSHNIEFACRAWGLRSTDLNQGVVYGWQPRFHYDEIFGTVLNRFVTEAVAGLPLTVYGEGTQKRAYLNILDTLQCVELALLNPPLQGEFRVFNQFTEVFSINDLAKRVSRVTGAKIRNLRNPRNEKERHYYKPKNKSLLSLGLKPHHLTEMVIEEMVENVKQYSDAIDHAVIKPTIKWK